MAKRYSKQRLGVSCNRDRCRYCTRKQNDAWIGACGLKDFQHWAEVYSSLAGVAVDRDRRAPEKTACYRLLARWALVQMCVPVTGAFDPGRVFCQASGLEQPSRSKTRGLIDPMHLVSGLARVQGSRQATAVLRLLRDQTPRSRREALGLREQQLSTYPMFLPPGV